eukprot:g3526.t1
MIDSSDDENADGKGMASTNEQGEDLKKKTTSVNTIRDPTCHTGELASLIEALDSKSNKKKKRKNAKKRNSKRTNSLEGTKQKKNSNLLFDDALVEQMRKLKETLKRKENEIVDTKATTETLFSENTALREELTKLKEDFASEIETLRKEHESTLEKMLEEKDNALRDAQKLIQEANAREEIRKDDDVKEKHLLEKMREQEESLQNELTTMRASIQTTQAKLTAEIQKTETEAGLREALEKSKASLETELADMRGKLEEVTKELVEEQNSMAALTTEKLKLQALHDANVKATAMKEALQEKKDAEKESDLSALLIEQEHMLANLRLEFDAEKMRAEKLSSEYQASLTSKDETIKSLKESFAKWQSDKEIERCLQRIVQSTTSQHLLDSQNELYGNQIHQLKKELDEVKKTLETTETKLNESQKELSNVRMQAIEQDKSSQATKQSLLDATNQSLLTADERAKDEIATMAEALVETEQTWQAKLNKQNAEHDIKLSELQTTHETKLSELQTTHETKLSELQKDHDTTLLELQKDHDTTLLELQTVHETKLSEFKTTISALEEKVSGLENENTNLQSNTKTSESDLKAKHEAAKEAWEKERLSLNSELNDLRLELTSLQEDAEAETLAMPVIVEKAEKDREALRMKVEKLNDEMINLTAEHSEAIDSLKQAHERDIKETVEKLRVKVKAKVDDLKTDLKTAKESLKKLEHRNKQLEKVKMTEEQVKKLLAMKKDRERLKSENKRLQKDIETLQNKEQISTSPTMVTKLREKLREYAIRIKKLEDINQTLRAESGKRDTDTTEGHHQGSSDGEFEEEEEEDMAQDEETKAKEEAMIAQRLAALSKRISTFKTVEKKLKSNVQTLEEKNQILQSQNTSLADKIKQLVVKGKSVLQEKETLEKSVNGLKKDLVKVKSDFQDAQSTVQFLEKENLNLVVKLQEKEDDADQTFTVDLSDAISEEDKVSRKQDDDGNEKLDESADSETASSPFLGASQGSPQIEAGFASPSSPKRDSTNKGDENNSSMLRNAATPLLNLFSPTQAHKGEQQCQQQ